MSRPHAGVGVWEGRGVGGPATAGKRWPHFFQMGKLRHKEFWELAQVAHSESAFGKETVHPKNEGPGPLLPSTLGSRDSREGPASPGCLERGKAPGQGEGGLGSAGGASW